ncbi:HD domain-containing phosphohydrolase [Geopsychrobacter electrodiphilus]|uniref:HD domain-containing phosphohydrolase n=1 Tax=Geopsychrobacter electrodiphilus TaxID=225196 RepID=UPI000366E216|nr:HD domain-containing phosphohydrolase [Geopsychrobacter electrodiphilus]
MNSLKIKILGLTIGITIIAVLLGAWHNLRTQSAMIERVAAHESRIISDTIHNSIRTSMSIGRNKDVASILKQITQEQTISGIRIIDPNGKILLSSSDAEDDQIVEAADLMTYRLSPEQFSFMTREGNRFISTLPIFNENDCHRCHNPQLKLLGILNVHLSLDGIDSLQRKGREATLLSSASIIVILIFSITFFILYYVDSPIRQMVEAMTKLENGEFEHASTDITSSREMSTLSLKFNRMVARLQSLIDSTITYERETAIHREKLSHQSELENMNMTLEDRLSEIEYLNITLEERLEEVEEANFKIADLAGDLEDRNTNLASAVNRLSSLYKMGLAVNSTMDLGQLFNLLLQKALDSLNGSIGYILLLDKNRNSLRIGSVFGLNSPVFDPRMSIELSRGGVSNWVIENREPVLIRKIEESRDFTRMSRLGFARETVICAPLFVHNEIFGTLTIANRPNGVAFSDEDLELLSTIAAQASVAIKNAQLYEDQQSTYLNTVHALVSAIEASDPYTRGHSERVTRYALALAKCLNLPEPSQKDLEQAAILHDIGKIGIDSFLLHKIDQLSPNDIDLLRQHPVIGMRILEPIQFLVRVREIIGQHHERFDGQGYPLGLSGEKLLFEARILSVVDSYDAMTSDRPYRKALSKDVALNEIGLYAGTQFDPRVAKAFIELMHTEHLTN